MRGGRNEYRSNRPYAYLLLRPGGSGSGSGREKGDCEEEGKEGRKKSRKEACCREEDRSKKEACDQEKGNQKILRYREARLSGIEADLKAVVLKTEDSPIGSDLLKH